MKWVSCEKKISPVNEEVLVYVIYESGTIDFTLSWIDEEGNWAMGSAKNFTVTHWMRLRKPK